MSCPRCGSDITPKPGAVLYCEDPKHCPLWRLTFMSDRDPLLQEREKTHGSFEDNAVYWDRLCKVVPFDWCEHEPVKRCAMNMILMKIARDLTNPNTKDTWDDIAGYAKLASESCQNPN